MVVADLKQRVTGLMPCFMFNGLRETVFLNLSDIMFAGMTHPEHARANRTRCFHVIIHVVVVAFFSVSGRGFVC